MNVLILTTHLDRGGVARYAVNLARGLSAGGNRVWISSSGGQWQDRCREAGAGFYRVPIRTKSILSVKVAVSLCMLLPFLVRNKIEVICANTRVTQFLSYLLSRCSGVPYVSVFHGFYRPGIERRLLQFEGMRTIAVSEAVKEHCLRDLNIPEEKLRVVYNGIAKDGFTRRQDMPGREGPCLRLGMLGRISSEKGHFLAVEAFALLKKKYPHLSFLIAGDGRLKGALLEKICALGLEETVRIESLEGERFLDMIDVLLFPSSREGFGFSILEGFAKKVCVVGFATGGIKEIIRHQETGILFDRYTPAALAEAVERLIEDDALRARLVENAYAVLDRFSLDRMAYETETVLKEAKEV